MRLPSQAAPVKRPQLVEPHQLVDVEHGTADQLVAMRMRLMHGADFNDPAPYMSPDPYRMRVSALSAAR
jgi:cyanobactin biosynthesis protein (PatB/AcyB/McaB family)